MWLRQVLIGRVVHTFDRSLYWLASLWRRMMYKTTFVVVSGSVGKTTAKEMIAAVLSGRGRTYRSIANQNSGVLLPLNVLRVRPWHQFAVIEISTSVKGVMPRSARLLRPDIAIMLAVRRTHTDAYPTLDECAAEKAQLFDFLSERGIGLLNGDDERVARMAERVPGRVRFFGSSPESYVWARNVSSAWPDRLSFEAYSADESVPVSTQLVGKHWLPSVLATLAVGRCAGISLSAAAAVINRLEPFRGRMQPVRLPNSAVVLRDDYQSSIDVANAAFAALGEARASRRLLVMTDMSDFDKRTQYRLKHIAAAAAGAADMAVFIGSKSGYGARRAVETGMSPADVFAFDTLQGAADFLKDELRAGDLMLLKGRVSDHVARLFFHQFGTVECWKKTCSKTMLCDECWELGVTEEELAAVSVVPPEIVASAPQSRGHEFDLSNDCPGEPG
jgi:UDP-N-acetylmuramoyl-tripeptide--D-alanyl-D-alanine ligase